MRCDDARRPAAAASPTGSVALDGAERGATSSSCLRCQAELVQYRKLLRRPARPARPRCSTRRRASLADILASLEEAGERRAVRSLLTGRRAAYLGGIAAATAAAAAPAGAWCSPAVTPTRRGRCAG